MELYFVDTMMFTESNQEIMMRLSYLLKIRKAHHLFLNGKVDEIIERVLRIHDTCNLYSESKYDLDGIQIMIQDDLVTVDGVQETLDANSLLVYDSELKSFTRLYLDLFLNHSISEGFIDMFVKELQEALQDTISNVTVKKLK